MTEPTIPLSEYAARRKKLLAALKHSVGLVFAGQPADPLHDDFRPHPHFEYLTGITDEPGAALLLDPTHPVASRREQLFLRPLDPEVEKWDGYRMEISKALRDRTGIATIFRRGQLGRFLNEAARRCKSLACLHPLAAFDQPVSADLRTFRKVAERVPGTEILDRTDVMATLRAVKSSKEVAMLQRAIDITASGFEAACRFVEPGMNEFDVQAHLEHAYRTGGSRGPAFGTIVGAGRNSTVLHYRANDQVIGADALICIDSGACFGGYGADITRTIPASGTFTDRQREIYDIVLKAEEAAIRAVKPGATLAQVDASARSVITKAGYGDFFIHGIGHHLGLETHDITPDGPLKAGNVITIEPGIYLPEEAIGVRIEDDVLVTREGHRVLSSKIPKSASAIEELMAR